MSNDEQVNGSGREEVTMTQRGVKGKIYQYNVGDNVGTYIEGVELYFLLNKTPEADKGLEFLTQVGQEAMNRIINSFKPAKVATKTYEEIKQKFKALFDCQINPFGQRFRLVTRKQQEGESLDDFAIELRNIAENIETTVETSAVLVQSMFVAGIQDKKVREGILRDATTTQTLDQLLDKAKSLHEAMRESEFMEKRSSGSLNAVVTQTRENFRGANQQASKNVGSNKMEVRCHYCQEVGHYKRDCERLKAKLRKGFKRNSSGQFKKHLNAVIEDFQKLSTTLDDVDMESQMQLVDDEGDVEFLNQILLGESQNSSPAFVEVKINKKCLLMEADTGACVSVCSFGVYKEKLSSSKLLPCDQKFKVVSGDKIKVLGKIFVDVEIRKVKRELSLVVIDSPRDFVPLLGRNWLNAFWPKWKEYFQINQISYDKGKAWVDKTVTKLKGDFASAFDDDLTKPIRDVVVDIRMAHDTKPFVHKPYTVAFKHREKVEEQIDKLEKVGILEKVEYAEWASPLVVVVKPNKDLRICMDGSKTVNPHIITHHYPIPLIDDLITNKSEAKRFCLIDLKGAYQQLVVSEETKKLLVVNTIKGLYAYTRLPFGVKPAATIFQSVMDMILGGMKNVQVYIDDILIWDKNDEDLLTTVEEVLKRLVKFNVKVNAEKCIWFVPEVNYLGHRLSAKGVSPNPEKVKAIMDVPFPDTVSKIKAYLGMVTFYSKFAPNLGRILKPLHNLLIKDKKFEWNEACTKAFESSKKVICSSEVLTHYDPNKPIMINCDASDDGISGVLYHVIDGKERPVFFVSRGLTKAEKNYPILHREALAIVYSMEKFYKYVMGQKVLIFTDHKPLIGVFKGKTNPSTIASRLQRYFHRLSIFDFEIKHKSGKENFTADCLSRLPTNDFLSKEDTLESERSSLTSLNFLVDDNRTSLNAEIIRAESENDELISRVITLVREGWPNHVKDPHLKGYYGNRLEFDIKSGCLVLGERVVIPTKLRVSTLQLLHANHRGIVKMKQLARKFFYWPNINADIENFERACKVCQITTTPTAPKVFGNWPETTRPFERVHIDFFHKSGQEFLILIDAFSRWTEVVRMASTKAERVEHELDKIFLVFGLPSSIVSDNGPPFRSQEFKNYCGKRNVEHILTPPYNPSSNGLVERAVGSTKAALTKIICEKGLSSTPQIDNIVKLFLHHRHQTPTTDGIIPNEKIFSYKPRNELNDLTKSKTKTFNSGINMTSELPERIKFKNNEQVIYYKRANGNEMKFETKIVKKLSDLVYIVDLDGRHVKAHCNQLKKIPQKHFTLRTHHNTQSSQPEAEEDASRPPIAVSRSPIISRPAEVSNSNPESSIERRYPRRNLPIPKFNIKYLLDLAFKKKD